MPKYTFTITQITGPYGNKYSLLTANEIRFGAASLSIIFCADIGPQKTTHQETTPLRRFSMLVAN